MFKPLLWLLPVAACLAIFIYVNLPRIVYSKSQFYVYCNQKSETKDGFEFGAIPHESVIHEEKGLKWQHFEPKDRITDVQIKYFCFMLALPKDQAAADSILADITHAVSVYPGEKTFLSPLIEMEPNYNIYVKTKVVE